MKRIAAFIVLLFTLSLPASASEVVDRIIAVVNDDIILASELEKSSGPFIVRATANVTNLAARAEAKKQVRKQVLESLISEALVNQEQT